LDYRYYDDDQPNRNIPYQLPESVEQSIKQFMKSKNLNCGSLDFMYGTDDNYYFLEVNPVGQFGWVSTNCNYYLEKRIAERLAKAS